MMGLPSANPRRIAAALFAALTGPAAAQDNPAHGTVRIADPKSPPELVWSHAASACSDTDYSDVPVRPFYGRVPGAKTHQLFWFASNATGYLATTGVPPAPGSDILAKMQRVVGADGKCLAWVKAGPYTEPPVQPANGVPQSYNTDLWMVAPFTPNGRDVFALIHNEFHGELTAPPGQPSIYCTITQPAPPQGQACGYWNIVGAISTDGGQSFTVGKASPESPYNAPVIALAHPYVLPADNGGQNPPQAGMVAQSNIIQWGRHAYILVNQKPSAAPADNPPHGQTIGTNGTCLYRTADLADSSAWRGWDGHAYTIKVVTRYPSDLPDPANDTCTPVVNGMYRFSWSYNTVLRQFILLGVDTNFRGKGTEAFVYTTAKLDHDGRFIQTSGEHLLREITWIDRWPANPTAFAQAYPSLLDPTSPDIHADEIPNRTPGDRNFQYSGANPYLYFTLFHPYGESKHHTDRDVVRQRLTVTPGDDSETDPSANGP